MAVPTPEHFLPLLYVLALKEEHETLTLFNDQPVGGSLTMTSLIIGSPAMNAQYAKRITGRQADGRTFKPDKPRCLR